MDSPSYRDCTPGWTTTCRPVTSGFVFSRGEVLKFSKSARQGATDTTAAGAQAPREVAGPAGWQHTSRRCGTTPVACVDHRKGRRVLGCRQVPARASWDGLRPVTVDTRPGPTHRADLRIRCDDVNGR